MRIKYLVGDATRPVGNKTNIIAHICNDKGGWGRGFVLALSERWPIINTYSSPEHAYREWSKHKWKGKDFVLGQIQTIWVEDTTFVCNMIAQRDYRPLEEQGVKLHLPNVNYSALLECLTRLRVECELSPHPEDISIHMPRIGSGFGKGSWDKIEKIINHVLEDSNMPIFIYDPQPVDYTVYYNLKQIDK
jgi:O-acetyl-ADP-ribose deacetylase (regulator of RNase III)